MPIIDIEIVTAEAENFNKMLVRELAEAAGRVLGSAPGTAWVKLRPLPLDQYAENSGGPPAGVLPVFVTVLSSKALVYEDTKEEVARLTAEVARTLGRPQENVHILYEPEASGRIAFGGKLIPR